LSLVAFAAYVAFFVTISGTLTPRPLGVRDEVPWNRREVFAWLCALASTMALPWSGAPISTYAGLGSWFWFPAAAASLFLSSPDKCGCFRERRFFSASNTAVVALSVFAFMSRTGVPGDIPGIEGMAALCAIEGLVGKCMAAARILFFVSCVISFSSAFNPSDRASVLLSFSYSAFISMAFLPPIRFFLTTANPGRTIITDAAAYVTFAFVIHHFIMKPFSEYFSPRWNYRAAAINAAITLSGMIFLFLSL
jgi:hypothetical protein